jgi:hypothetical protein
MSRRWKVALIATVASVLGLQLLYVAAVNLALGLAPRHYHTRYHEQLYLDWHAWSPWYGRFYVRDFHMRFQDPNDVQLDLTVDRADVDLSISSLLHRRITFGRIRADGAALRMVTKVSQDEANRFPRRIAAFPRMQSPGFSPVSEGTGPRHLTQKDIERLWRIELRDTEGVLKEIWFDEYRYVGVAVVRGEIAFEPDQSITVAPTFLHLDGGTLSAGPHVIASQLTAHVQAALAPTFNIRERPQGVIRALSGRLRLDADIAGLEAVELYGDGLMLDGAGVANADITLNEGRISRESHFAVGLDRLEARSNGFALKGHGRLDAAGAAKGAGLDLKAALDGTLASPPLGGQPLVMNVREASATMSVSSRDLAGPPRFLQLAGRVREVRAPNARPLTREAAKRVPVLANVVLGDGPLTASGDILVTRRGARVRLNQARLGSAVVQGTAQRSKGRWNGAAAGVVGGLNLGVKLQDSRAKVEPFIGKDWLRDELQRLGLEPTPPRPAPPRPGS